METNTKNSPLSELIKIYRTNVPIVIQCNYNELPIFTRLQICYKNVKIKLPKFKGCFIVIDINEFILKLCPPSSYFFTVTKIGNVFIHTSITQELCDFAGMSQQRILNHSLHDIFPKDYADIKTSFYEKAWLGESAVNLFEPSPYLDSYLLKVNPIYENGIITQVAGSCYPFPTKIFGVA